MTIVRIIGCFSLFGVWERSCMRINEKRFFSANVRESGRERVIVRERERVCGRERMRENLLSSKITTLAINTI